MPPNGPSPDPTRPRRRARARGSRPTARAAGLAGPGPRPAFSLIELLVCIAIVSILLALLLPGLAGVRGAARAGACASNQRQIALGWSLYADAHGGLAMPLADERSAPAGTIVYWWGAVTTGPGGAIAVDHARGFLTPYLHAAHGERSVYECPGQPWGTYRAQPMGATPPGVPTSTYGYNGYYLCPPATPGWNTEIGRQPWKRLADVERPADLFVLADALLPGQTPRNTALLDPPRLWSAGGGWRPNESPTTAFRHGSAGAWSAQAARADASVRAHRADRAWLVGSSPAIGSVGAANDPHYVPDWRRWR